MENHNAEEEKRWDSVSITSLVQFPQAAEPPIMEAAAFEACNMSQDEYFCGGNHHEGTFFLKTSCCRSQKAVRL